MSDNLWFGKYKIVKMIGEGATAKVYLATHIGLDQKRAIKCISKSYISLEQAKQEAYLLIQLKSPAIPIIYDIEEDETYLYIIEEYMEGESLLSYRIQSHQLSETFILKLALQICEFMKYLHSMQIPILYLDLKPSNFRIQNGQLKLIDFGAARYKYDKKVKSNYGSKGYAAPEQYLSDDLDEESDIYGIGMLLYFLITGDMSSNNQDITNIREIKGYSRALLDLVAKSVKHNPCERYVNVQTLERRVMRLLDRSKKEKNMTNSSKKIALIGSEEHVGVTHLSFYLLAYLTAKGYRTIYVECNPSDVVMRLATSVRNCASGFIQYHNCRVTKQEWLPQIDLQEYDYIIYDYGSVCDSRLSQFVLADQKITVLGGREWERLYTDRIIDRLRNEKDTTYVLNHMTAREFYDVAKRIKGMTILRMPQECDAFSTTSLIVKRFVDSLIE